LKTKYIDGISIIIPSYNRKNQLCRLLDSIQKENLSYIHEIVVVDNDSDYDVIELLNKYSDTNIRVVRNSFNVRQGTNMMNTFLHCKTKWMWLISDDDEICDGAIKIISKKIKKNNHAGYLKFSTEGSGIVGIERNKEVNSLEEFIAYYSSDKLIRRGNAIFISNGIFNLEHLQPFLGYGFEYSYTYVSYLIPVLLSLNNNIPVVFSEEKIVFYHNPGDEQWPFDKVALGLSTLSHLPLDLEKHFFKKLLDIFMIVKFQVLFFYLLKNKTDNAARVYNLIHNNIYKFHLTRTKRFISYFLSVLLNYPWITNILFKNYIKRKSN
jgi:abequosyltransferase